MGDSGRITTLLGAILIMSCGQSSEDETHRPFSYPEAPRSDTVDDYHGQRIPDPYRPLEDPDAPATRAWVEAENRITFALPGIDPRARSDPRAADRALGLREIRALPFAKEDATSTPTTRAFRTRASSTRPIPSMIPARVLLDPNTLSADGTVALAGTSVSDDGRLLAYGIAAAGSDWNEWKVRDVATGQDYPDHLKWIKFSGAEWAPDGKGFFYGRFPEPKTGEDLKGANYYQKVYLSPAGDRSGRRPPGLGGSRAQGMASRPARHRRRPVPDPHDREGDRRQVPRSSTGRSTSPKPGRSTWSASSTPSTTSSTTTGRSSGSRPTRTPRAARSSRSTPASPSPRTGSS